MELRPIYRVDPVSREETKVEWSSIKRGDLFRIEPIDAEDAKKLVNFGVLEATSDAYLNDKGIWTIEHPNESSIIRQIHKEEDARVFDYLKKAAE